MDPQRLRQERLPFFLRPRNVPLCCFLCEALRRFPQIVTPTVLQQWMVVWTARHALADVMVAFHATLMPFTMSTIYAAALEGGEPAVTEDANGTEGNHGRRRTSYADTLRDSVTLLDAVFATARQWTVDGGRIEACVRFMWLYENIVLQRPFLLLRCEPLRRALVEVHEAEGGAAPGTAATPTRTDEEKARYALRHLLPFTAPSRILQTAPPAFPEEAGSTRIPSIPAVMRPANVRVPVTGALLRAVLLAVMPPNQSLLELQAAAAASTAALRSILHGEEAGAGGIGCVAAGLSSRCSAHSFYHPLVPESVRALYVLTAAGHQSRTSREKHVPLVQLQQLCQLTDEGMLLVLKELEMAGLAAANMRDYTARSLLLS